MKRVYIFAIAFVVFAYLPVYATIINIPDDYPTIQQGIDASIDGDTVLVQPGTYVENINFNRHNIILGSLFLTTGNPSYISSTIIDGNGVNTVVSFQIGETNDAKIIGFTIQNGLAGYGGGIFCISSSPTISYNTINGNSATDYGGGGIFCYNSTSTITYNTINENSAEYHGGGILCQDSNPTISHNTISENSTHRGGGIFCVSSNPTINYNIINGNSATNYGGGIACQTSNPEITNNTISANSADYGGGIACLESSPTISNNTISENSADYDGGAIYCSYSNSTIFNNTISESTAGISGGGIHIRNNSNLNITNTIFWADSAPTEPEIFLDGTSSPVITYCDVQGGWEGEGNIDCDPMFCDPENGNFYLDAASCCVGAGEGGVNIGAFGVGCGGGGDCVYMAGDCDHNGVPLELSDVITMIGMYRGTVESEYTCDCPPHGDAFAPEADPNGNCVAFELGDAVTEIAAYRGTIEASGCADCFGLP